MKAFLDKEDKLMNKLVTFYVIYTCIYFPILLASLFLSGGIYNAGKYNFQSVITIIVVAELTKYFASVIHFRLTDVNLNKKPEERSLIKVVSNLLSRTKVFEGFKNVFLVFVTTIIFFLVSVLYGAEVFSKHEETVMFSLLLSVLTVLPASINLGSGSLVNLFVSKPSDLLGKLMYFNFQLTIFGAWLGAFVIPLDWDRPWQQWPISCSTGAMLGFFLSHAVKLFQIMSSPSKKSKAR